jgi:uracil-DNA glycosylase
VSDRPSASESARLLRQRMEMGGNEIFLDGMTRRQAIEIASTAGRSAPSSASLESTSPEPASRETAASASTPAEASTVVPAPKSPRPEATSGKVKHGGGAALPTLPDSYPELRTIAMECTRCRLSESRTQVVFSDGPSDARLMVVGEAPGANEDESGVPFVGAAGKYLDFLLSTVGLNRGESVYIANVLKCRPPGNRNPLPDEIETCSPFLKKQIDLVRPKVLLAVGSFSGQLLTGREKVALGKIRGEIHSYHGVPLVVTYHPAALLRNAKWTRLFWEDLQLLRDVLDGE